MIRAASATIFALLAVPALAVDRGVYIGASTGQANVRDTDELGGFELDGDDNSFKAILGFRADSLAIEFNYVDLGQPQQTFAGRSVQIDAKGYDGFLVLSKRIALLELFAKAGIIAWKVETSVQGLNSVTNEGSDFGFGAGAQLVFGGLAVRAEYEQFEISDIDAVNLVSVGLTWTFR